MKYEVGRMWRVAGWASTGIMLAAVLVTAQTPHGPVLSLTATTDTAGTVKIDILRWSSDEERDHLLTAWTNPAPPAPAAEAGRGRGRGGAAPPAGETKQEAAATPAAPARAGGGRGGRGGRGGGAPPAPPATPESSLTAALANAPTVGYLWSSAEVAGYALRSAVRVPAQDGGERIFLITDRRLGEWNNGWKLPGAAAQAGNPTNYEFSVIEIKLNSKGAGEGRTSLTGKVAADNADKTIGLENYSGLPVVLKNVMTRKP